MQKKYRNQGVVFIGLTTDDESMMDYMESFLHNAGIKWLNGYGAGNTLRQLKAHYIPAVWVIGSDGRVAWNKSSQKTLEEGIEEAIRNAKKRSS